MTAQFRLAHPSRKRLLDWLNDETSSNLTPHVEQCDRCAATLEALASDAGTDTHALPAELGAAISEVFAPPTDLSERVLEQISERERAQREMSLLFGMISISKDVAELMMPLDDRSSSRRTNDDQSGNGVGESQQ